MRRILGILVMMILSVTTAMSRQMSVAVTPILTPPYTTSLSKMSESGSTSLMEFKAEVLDNLMYCITVFKAPNVASKGIKVGLTISGILTVGDAVFGYMSRVIEANEKELKVWFENNYDDNTFDTFKKTWDAFYGAYQVTSSLQSIASNLQGGNTIKLLYDGLGAISMYMSESSDFIEEQIKDCKILREQLKILMDNDVIY